MKQNRSDGARIKAILREMRSELFSEHRQLDKAGAESVAQEDAIEIVTAVYGDDTRRIISN